MDEAVRAAIAAEVDVDEAVANSVAYNYTSHDAIPHDSSTVERANFTAGAEAPTYDYTSHVEHPQDPPAADEFTSRPLGKVCPPGQELTGRWTREEQERFMEGLERYGKEWKKVAAVVETRFQKKLSKAFSNPNGEVSVEDFNGAMESVGGRNRLRVTEAELQRFRKFHTMFSSRGNRL
eukprot:scaffold15508_cov66-Cyclotella_meneghiniana.AAC.15